jgi:hypothetical protein
MERHVELRGESAGVPMRLRADEYDLNATGVELPALRSDFLNLGHTQRAPVATVEEQQERLPEERFRVDRSPILGL